jgi:hypothetical protein
MLRIPRIVTIPFLLSRESRKTKQLQNRFRGENKNTTTPKPPPSPPLVLWSSRNSTRAAKKKTLKMKAAGKIVRFGGSKVSPF